MALEELVVGPHQTAHHVDEVPEDLHSAHTEEVLRRGVSGLHRPAEGGGETVYGRVGIGLVGGHAGEIVAAHLGAGLQQEPKVLLLRVFAFNQVTERRPHRHRPVAVAELPVVVHLEAGAHRMVLDAKGVEDGVVLVDGVPKVIVETVLVGALPRRGAAEAADAAALEREVLDVDDVALIGKHGYETVDHPLQPVISGEKVRDDDSAPFRLLLRHGLGRRFGQLPQRKIEPVLRLLPSFLFQEIVHVGGKPFQAADAHILAVVLDEPMGGDVIEVLGGGDLRSNLAGEILPGLFHQLDEPMELVRDQESVDWIAEDDELRLPEHPQCR